MNFVVLDHCSKTTTKTLSGSSYQDVFPSFDIGKYTKLDIVLKNDGTQKIESGSVQWSPDNSVWFTLPHVSSSFAGLAVNATQELEINNNCRNYLKIVAIPSGTAGTFSGSMTVYLNANNG